MAPTQSATRSKLDPQIVKVSLAIIAGGITVIFDSTIVNVALPELTGRLGASVTTIQWVSTGYLLAMFLAIPATGWLQARLGGKRLWLFALTGFLIGSVLCSLAWSVESLIAFRVVQGLAGGVMMPLMMTLIMQAAKGQPLGRLMAVVGLPAALGPILGPVLGGVILGSLSWHWLFLVNVPICLVGLWLAWKLVPDDRPAADVRKRKLDIIGLSLIAPGVVAVIFGLSELGGDAGFGSPDMCGPIAIGVLLIAAFVLWATPRGDRALLDLRLLRHGPLAVSSALLFLTGIASYGAMFLLPMYFQTERGETALAAGLLLIPQGIGTLVSRSLGGRLTDSIGPRTTAIIGFSVITLGTLPFAFTGGATDYWWLGLVLFVRGLGMGLAMTPLMAVAYIGLDRHEMPDASIFTRVTQQLGGSFGTAVLAVALTATIADPADLGSVASGFDQAFWWATALSALAVPLSLFLPKRATQDGC